MAATVAASRSLAKRWLRPAARAVSACPRPAPPSRRRPGGEETVRPRGWRGEAPLQEGDGPAGPRDHHPASPAAPLSRGGGVRLVPAGLPPCLAPRPCSRRPVAGVSPVTLAGEHPPRGGEPRLGCGSGAGRAVPGPGAPLGGLVPTASFFLLFFRSGAGLATRLLGRVTGW